MKAKTTYERSAHPVGPGYPITVAKFVSIVEYLGKAPEIAEIIVFLIKTLKGKSSARFPGFVEYLEKLRKLPKSSVFD